MSAGAVSVTAGRPAAPEREGHMLQVQERGGAHVPGSLRGTRSGHNVMPLMNTFCIHTGGAVPCTATSLHVYIVTHSVMSAQHDYSCMYV